MTARVVNLRGVRKEKARSERKDAAAARAAKFGRTKEERRAEEDAAARAARHLDDHRRETE